MSKRRIVLVAVIVFIIIVCGLLGIIMYNNLTDYSSVLKINWNINLPKKMFKEVYSVDDGPSFHGDGIRYHVFSYEENDETEINKIFDWSIDEKNSIYNEVIDNWLSEIKVSKEMYPYYSNCRYWYNRHDDNSEIIILWDSNENKLFVVESFL